MNNVIDITEYLGKVPKTENEEVGDSISGSPINLKKDPINFLNYRTNIEEIKSDYFNEYPLQDMIEELLIPDSPTVKTSDNQWLWHQGIGLKILPENDEDMNIFVDTCKELINLNELAILTGKKEFSVQDVILVVYYIMVPYVYTVLDAVCNRFNEFMSVIEHLQGINDNNISTLSREITNNKNVLKSILSNLPLEVVKEIADTYDDLTRDEDKDPD